MHPLNKNIFVFVVCGADKHIQTLNFSLRYLKHFSRNEIIVVTDLSRNNIDIDHDNVLNIHTPDKFNHHQASIFLKVSLHKILDTEHNYCYLDSDVIAVDERVDEVFNYKTGPVTFASDHCSLREFSPNAMNCGCNENRINNIKLLTRLEKEYFQLEQEYFVREKAFRDKYVPKDPEIFERYEQLQEIINEYCITYKRFLKVPSFIQFVLAHLNPEKYNFEHYLTLHGDFKWDHREKKVFDSENNFLFDAAAIPPQYPSYYKHIKDNSNFIWNDESNFWVDENRNDIYAAARCDHLREAIRKKFKVNIPDNNWLHWNGGVFLFDRSSVEFMNTWCEHTMEIFKDNDWKTRDQGALIVTAWKCKLHDQKRLPAEFNFLADFNNEHLRFDIEKGFSFDNFKTTLHPSFLHIYHNFGKKGWDVWDYIEGLSSKSKIVI
ncbi:MAG: hypothetical protein ABII90_03165 [Bacteroidota bacterium]